MRWISTLFAAIAVVALSACAEAASRNEACEFNVNEYLTPIQDPEADEFFEIAKSFDIDIISNRPDMIREDLRGADYNRQDARRYYQKAADLGHLKAMNALAAYMLQGFGRTDGTYDEEPEAAFQLYTRIAEHGEARGYQGMSAMLMEGFPNQPVDIKLATKCMTRAAMLAEPAYLEPAFYLAELDLNLGDAFLKNPPHPKPRIERGLALMEDLLLKNYIPAYRALYKYYVQVDGQPRKAEFYARAAAAAGDYPAKIRLEAGYRMGYFGEVDLGLSTCASNLTRKQIREIETLCPRPEGPLTRAKAELPPAPEQLLDIPAYLEAFNDRHSDL